MASISNDRKPIGRPKVGATHIGVRVPPEQLALIDGWIAKQPEPQPSRPEAIRQLVDAGLAMKAGKRGA